MAAGECIAALYHGKGWRKKIGTDGLVGAMLIARQSMEVDAWIMAHAKRGRR